MIGTQHHLCCFLRFFCLCPSHRSFHTIASIDVLLVSHPPPPPPPATPSSDPSGPLSFDVYVLSSEQYCCAALCLVAQDVRNCVLIINEGAIPHMLAGAKDGDVVTKQSCCAVLSTLSSKAS